MVVSEECNGPKNERQRMRRIHIPQAERQNIIVRSKIKIIPEIPVPVQLVRASHAFLMLLISVN